jgi:hypothetical protein
MTWAEIISIIALVVALLSLLYQAVIHRRERYAHDIPLILHIPSLIEQYKKTSKPIFNPGLLEEKEIFLNKLGGSNQPTPKEAKRLIQILKDELAHARHNNMQDAVLAIRALIRSVQLLTHQRSPNSG